MRVQLDGGRELTVEAPDFRQNLVGPVPPARAGGKTDSVGDQHRVPCHLLTGIEIFPQQGRRHCQRIARVGESLTSGTLGRKFASRIQPDTGQVTNRIRVLSIVESSECNRPGISGTGQCLGIQVPFDPTHHQLALSGAGLGRLLWRHLAIGQHLDHLQPRPGPLADLDEGSELLEIQFSNFFLRRVTSQAVFPQQRPDRLLVLGGQAGECRRVPGNGRTWREQHRREQDCGGQDDDHTAMVSTCTRTGKHHGTSPPSVDIVTKRRGPSDSINILPQVG